MRGVLYLIAGSNLNRHRRHRQCSGAAAVHSDAWWHGYFAPRCAADKTPRDTPDSIVALPAADSSRCDRHLECSGCTTGRHPAYKPRVHLSCPAPARSPARKAASKRLPIQPHAIPIRIPSWSLPRLCDVDAKLNTLIACAKAPRLPMQQFRMMLKYAIPQPENHRCPTAWKSRKSRRMP